MADEISTIIPPSCDEGQWNGTLEVIDASFSQYVKIYEIDQDNINCDGQLINKVIERYWLDVDRIHHFHPGTELIDCHKIAGYLMYWLVKLKPFSVINEVYEENTNAFEILFCNELIAFIVGVARLNSDREKRETFSGITQNRIIIPPEFVRPFIYSLHFRNLSADSLSLVFYFLDKLSSSDPLAQLIKVPPDF